MQSIRKTTKYLFLFFIVLSIFAGMMQNTRGVSYILGRATSTNLITVSYDEFESYYYYQDYSLKTGYYWYRDLNFSMRFTFPQNVNATHSFYADYISTLNFTIARANYNEPMMVIFNAYRWNTAVFSPGWGGDYYSPGANNSFASYKWNSFGTGNIYTVIPPTTSIYPNYTIKIWENIYDVQIRLRIMIPRQFVSAPQTTQLYVIGYLDFWGLPSGGITSDLIDAVIQLSVLIIFVISIPLMFGRMFGRKGVGLGFLIMAFMSYIVYSNILISFIVGVIGLLFMFKKESE